MGMSLSEPLGSNKDFILSAASLDVPNISNDNASFCGTSLFCLAAEKRALEDDRVDSRESVYLFVLGSVTFDTIDAQQLLVYDRRLVDPLACCRCPWCFATPVFGSMPPYVLCLQPHLAKYDRGTLLTPLTPRMFCPGCFDELYRGACVPGRPPFLPSKPFLAAALGPADVVGQLGFLHLTKCHNLQEMLQMLESSALVPALEARLRRLAAAWGPAPRPPLRAIPEFAARLQRHRLCTLEVRSREQDLRLGGGEGRAAGCIPDGARPPGPVAPGLVRGRTPPSLVAPLGEVALRGGEPAVSVPPVPHAAPLVLRGTEGLLWSPAAHACDTVAVDTDD